MWWYELDVYRSIDRKKHRGMVMVVITIKPIVRERFHPFNPGLQLLTYKIPPNNPDWYVCWEHVRWMIVRTLCLHTCIPDWIGIYIWLNWTTLLFISKFLSSIHPLMIYNHFFLPHPSPHPSIPSSLNIIHPLSIIIIVFPSPHHPSSYPSISFTLLIHMTTR